MTEGRLYGIGVGPGDPELLTLKAVRLLGEADIIAVPDKGTGEKTALNIVKDFVVGKELLYCPTPMVRDGARLEACYEEIATKICDLLKAGKTVAFITLGDPTVYSTYIYVHKKVLARGYGAELIPGVPSFCAVAAELGVSLCEGGERLLVVPASYEG
ncbi:MAG: precorrin-2 C(20)-methyltransferase, partial [Oscillospiraceae bacterium]